VKDYDALITNQQGVGLMIQQADCQALLMHDPVRQVIGAVHCGWRGSAANIIGLTITEMQRSYQTDPAALLVAISPSLGPCCAEFINYRQELPKRLHRFQESPNHFNFWDISTHQLVEAGVSAKHIDAARICTACNRDYFSYRRAKKKRKITTGRNCSVICLPLS
jgi:YfiH family protein